MWVAVLIINLIDTWICTIGINVCFALFDTVLTKKICIHVQVAQLTYPLLKPWMYAQLICMIAHNWFPGFWHCPHHSYPKAMINYFNWIGITYQAIMCFNMFYFWNCHNNNWIIFKALRAYNLLQMFSTELNILIIFSSSFLAYRELFGRKLIMWYLYVPVGYM